ncbi:MAG: hypothetical protein IAE89_12435 [Anaerolineae bacterium]|nr:hypothetical protein [Anaerolineae bacterium]
MIAATRETFNLHPGGMIFGADITLDRVLEVERLPEAFIQSLERWLPAGQIRLTTVGQSMERNTSAGLWEWQSVLTAHDIGIYTAASPAFQPLWINTDAYWHAPAFSDSRIEAIFIPDLAENQALAAATSSTPIQRTAAVFLSVSAENVIDVIYGVTTTADMRMAEINLSAVKGCKLDNIHHLPPETPHADLCQQSFMACRIALAKNK